MVFAGKHVEDLEGEDAGLGGDRQRPQHYIPEVRMGADTLGVLTDDNHVTPARWHQPPRVRSVSFGSIRASYVVDGSSKLAPATLFPDSGEDYWRERPEYLDSD